MTTENLNFNVEKLPLCCFLLWRSWMNIRLQFDMLIFIAKRIRYPPLANYSVSFWWSSLLFCTPVECWSFFSWHNAESATVILQSVLNLLVCPFCEACYTPTIYSTSVEEVKYMTSIDDVRYQDIISLDVPNLVVLRFYWQRWMIDRYDQLAQKSGSKVPLLSFSHEL